MSRWIAAVMLSSVGCLAGMSSTLARSELSTSVVVPVASVVDEASTLASEVASEVASTAVVLPAALSEVGATLVVVAVAEGAKGSVYLLERASDGARISIRIGSELAGGIALSVGTTIEATAVVAGTALSVAGEVIALIPNEIGQALTHHELIAD
ncbi:MAG: hypothetical protein KDI51_09030 [Xanthomonadales bacterium]|nr:hypothetical protein [Xanthomonadales bacterium]